MNRLRELLARLTERTLTADEQAEFTSLLAELSTEELAEVRSVLDQRVDDAADDDGPAGLDLLRAVQPLMAAVNDAQANADQAAADAEAERQRLLSEIRGSETAPEEPAEAPSEEEAPAEPAAEPAPAEAPAQPEAVAAAAATRPVTRPRLSGARAPQGRGHRADGADEDLSITVGGRRVQSWTDAYAAAAHELAAFGPVSDGEPTRNIGIIHAERRRDPAQTLRAGMTLPSNRELARALHDGDSGVRHEALRAIVAAGGFSAPGTPVYDINQVSTDARPIDDGLPKLQASRGQILYRKATSMGDSYTSGVGIWNSTTDASSGALAATPTVTKNIVRITIPSVTTVGIEAVTTRAVVGNFIDRTDPELVEFMMGRLAAEQARAAENEYLTQLIAASDQKLTFAAVEGFAADFFFALDRSVGAYEYRNRTDPNTRLSILLPEWIKDAIRSDIALQQATAQGPVSPFSTTDAWINDQLALRNLDVTWHLDTAVSGEAFGATQTAGALAAYPTTAHWWIWAPGTVLLLDGGTLDLGIVRDSVLNQTNDMQFFAETFQALVNLGPEVTQVIQTFNVSGVRKAAA